MGRQKATTNYQQILLRKLILEAYRTNIPTMATLDDKLLGEKLHYYCSSSEDEAGSDDENDTNSGSSATFIPSQPWDGSSANTGPKGVLKDWQRYKQLEAEMREEAEIEKLDLAKKLALTCRSTNED